MWKILHLCQKKNINWQAVYCIVVKYALKNFWTTRKWKLTILTLADLATILAISLRRTRLVTPLPSPPGRTRAGASHGVTRGAVMARTRVPSINICIVLLKILYPSHPQAGPHRPGGQDTEHVLPPYPWSHWHVSGATHVPCSQRGLKIFSTE